jgi:chitin disaccharide deacetylase
MKLIVNGDDFGASRGVNRGILEAHTRGVLTSTSMIVEASASEEAAALSSAQPELGVGLHVVMDPAAERAAALAVERQLERFVELTERLPTHIDSHRKVHHDRRLLPAFVAVADRLGVPLRGHCGVRHISSFYGQWNGETHPEQITPRAFAGVVPARPDVGFAELCCHPGYPDQELESSYRAERQLELQTLCDAAVADFLRERGIELTTFRELSAQ